MVSHIHFDFCRERGLRIRQCRKLVTQVAKSSGKDMLSIRAKDVASIAALPEPVRMTGRLTYSLKVRITAKVSRVGSRQPMNRRWRGLGYCEMVRGLGFEPKHSVL